MRMRAILVLILISCSYAVVGKTVDNESARRLLESSYQEVKTEDSFVMYVSFLINRGGREDIQAWLDEAELLIAKYEWESNDRRLKVIRNLCLKRADLMMVEERHDYLIESNKLYPVDYRDSLTVLLEVTIDQYKNLLDGKDTPAALFTRQTRAYIQAEIDNKISYLETMFQHGRSVYYVDEIFLMKAGSIIDELKEMPLQESELMRYLSLSVKLSILSGELDRAVNILTQLEAMDGCDVMLMELLEWTIREFKSDDFKGAVPARNIGENIERLIRSTTLKRSESQPIK